MYSFEKRLKNIYIFPAAKLRVADRLLPVKENCKTEDHQRLLHHLRLLDYDSAVNDWADMGWDERESSDCRVEEGHRTSLQPLNETLKSLTRHWSLSPSRGVQREERREREATIKLYFRSWWLSGQMSRYGIRSFMIVIKKDSFPPAVPVDNDNNHFQSWGDDDLGKKSQRRRRGEDSFIQ